MITKLMVKEIVVGEIETEIKGQCLYLTPRLNTNIEGNGYVINMVHYSYDYEIVKVVYFVSQVNTSSYSQSYYEFNSENIDMNEWQEVYQLQEE